MNLSVLISLAILSYVSVDRREVVGWASMSAMVLAVGAGPVAVAGAEVFSVVLDVPFLSRRIRLLVVYRKPSSNIQNFLHDFENIINTDQASVIMGDFNDVQETEFCTRLTKIVTIQKRLIHSWLYWLT